MTLFNKILFGISVLLFIGVFYLIFTDKEQSKLSYLLLALASFLNIINFGLRMYREKNKSESETKKYK